MLPMQAHAAPCNAACVDGDMAYLCAHFGSEGLDLVCADKCIGDEGAAAVADKLASVPGLTTLGISGMQHVGGRRECRVYIYIHTYDKDNISECSCLKKTHPLITHNIYIYIYSKHAHIIYI